MNNSIEIKNASFVYKTEVSKKEVVERKVLHIGNLEIKQGEITFIIGRSGSGKSTLLETIGLMNDTFPKEILPDMDINFLIDDKMKDILRPRIWDKEKEIEAKLSQIRLDNFSFIFQNTNLLSNFTAIDNVCITDMLNGRSYSEAFLKSLIIFSLLGLGDLDIDIYPQNISGGQRQRVAFARAIIPDYQFLFGDEPTGNLDRETSIEVLQLLSDFIRGTNSNTSTIIVSHDLDLALRFADRIIVITKDEIGQINPENIFIRGQENMIQEDARRSFLFKTKIIDAFKNNAGLVEGIKQIIENAKASLNETPTVKSRGFIKIDELLGKLLELMRDPSKRKAEIQGLTFFDEAFNAELESIILPKSEDTAKANEKDSVADELKSWKRVNEPDGEGLGKKELKRLISKLLKFQKVSEKVKVEDKEPAQVSSQPKMSPIFFLFTILCKIQRKFFFKLKADKLSHPLADINNPDFSNLFIKNEGGILLGAGQKLAHFRTLFFALFVTFLGIGFATGSLNYLREKMDDPFVNFVTTAVPSEKQSEVASIIEHYNKDTVMLSKYRINVFTGFTIFPLEIYNKKSNDLSLITGRTITLNDPLLKELFKEKENIVAGNRNGLFNEYDCGFIVSEGLLTKLGLTPDARFIKVKILTTNAGVSDTTNAGEANLTDQADNYELVPVPIRAVLKKIPGDLNQDIDFLITDYMHLNLLDNHEPSKEYPFHPVHSKSLVMYYNTGDSTEIRALRDTVKSIVRKHASIMLGFKMRNLNLINFEEYRENIPFIFEEMPSAEEGQETGAVAVATDSTYTPPAKNYINPGFQIQVGFMGRKPDYAQIITMYDSIATYLAAMKFDISKLELVYQPNKRPVELKNTNPRLDRMIIHFKKLDKVEEFSKFLETTKYKYLRLDMAKIMSMKNYNYVANLTTGIIIFLIALSVYFISYFVANVIANHLDRIRMNIGTLMAFGTSGLKYIYMNLISAYMIISIIVAFVAVCAAGYAYTCRGILWLIYFFRRGFRTDFSLEPGSYFDIFNEWTLVAVVLIFILSSILSRMKINEVLKETPGNLIFGREG